MTLTISRNYDGYGSGMISPDGTMLYINIAKNASSFMNDTLHHNGWTSCRHGHDTVNYDNVQQMLIILRDPVDRWISGVAQYLLTKILNSVGSNTYLDTDAAGEIEDSYLPASSFIIAYNLLAERLIFDNLDLLDDHVWLQHDFFREILPDVPRRYIVLPCDLDQELGVFGISKFAGADRNSSVTNQDKQQLKTFFRQRLDTRPTLLRKVKLTYAQDYELIRHAIPNL